MDNQNLNYLRNHFISNSSHNTAPKPLSALYHRLRYDNTAIGVKFLVMSDVARHS